MKYLLHHLGIILFLAGFSSDGGCLVKGEWEFFDQVTFKPRKVCVDLLDRKWFIATDGIWMFDGSAWTRFTQSTIGIPMGAVNTMAVAENGALWFGTMYNGAFCFDGTSWRSYNADNSGIGNNWINGIAFDRDGGVWFATPDHAVLLKNGRWSRYSAESYLGGYAGLGCIAVDENGYVWAGTWGEGALRFDGSAWRQYSHRNSGLASRGVHTIRALPGGGMVFGTNSHAFILDGSSWETIPVYSAESIGWDEYGMLWLSNEFGFSCYHHGNLAEFPSWSSFIGEGATDSQKKIYDMALDREGSLWFAAGKGVYRYSGRFVQIAPLPKPQTSDLPVIAAGSLLPLAWIARGVDRVVLEYSLDSVAWNRITAPLDAAMEAFDWAVPRDFLPAGYLAATVALRITAAEDSFLAHTLNIRVEAPGLAESMAEFTPYNSGLASHEVRGMAEDAGGAKWFATNKGVSRFDGMSWQTFTAENSGLIGDEVNDCAQDGMGNLWFATGNGLSRYDGAEWMSWFAGNPVVKIGAGGSTVWAVCADSLTTSYHSPVNPALWRWEGNSWTPCRTAAGDTLTGYAQFSKFAVDRSGNLWLDRYVRATPDAPAWHTPKQQLIRCDGADWNIYPLDDILNTEERINRFTWDSTGKLRGIVQYSNDVVSFDGKSWERIRMGSGSGPGPAYPERIQCDRENTLWGVSRSVVQVFDGARWKIWDAAHGWPSNQVGMITGLFIDRNDVKWLIGGSGVTRFDHRIVPVEERKELPRKFGITGNYPNPFNPSTIIEFTLPEPGRVSFAIYSITGQKVREILSYHKPYKSYGTYKTYRITWDGRDNFGKPVSSGVYIARLQAGKAISCRKMLLMK